MPEPWEEVICVRIEVKEIKEIKEIKVSKNGAYLGTLLG